MGFSSFFLILVKRLGFLAAGGLLSLSGLRQVPCTVMVVPLNRGGDVANAAA